MGMVSTAHTMVVAMPGSVKKNNVKTGRVERTNTAQNMGGVTFLSKNAVTVVTVER
jgi:hypothetical protein